MKAFLTHTNPYTGLRYVDDPALAVVEVHNEDCIFWGWPLNALAEGKEFPRHTARLKARWAAWLKQRYGNDEKLRAAWGAGMRSGDSVDNPDMGIYGTGDMRADGPRNKAEKARVGDYVRFLAELQRGYYEQRVRTCARSATRPSSSPPPGGPAAPRRTRPTSGATRRAG